MRTNSSSFLLLLLLLNIVALNFAIIPWPASRGNARRNGHSLLDGPQNSVTSDYKVNNVGFAPEHYVVGIDNILYSISGTDGTVSAYSQGVLKWQRSLKGINYAAAIGSDGTVYVGNKVGTIFALKGRTGATVWKYTLTVDERINSDLIISESDILYFTTNKKVYALNTDVVGKKWVYRLIGTNNDYIAAGDDYLYVKGDNIMRAFHLSTGELEWTYEHSRTILSNFIVSSENMIYCTDYDYVIAIDGSLGIKKWKEELTEVDWLADGNNGLIYTAGSPDQIVALRKTDGTRKWSFNPEDSVYKDVLVGADETVYAYSSEYLVALDSGDGDKQWKTSIGGFDKEFLQWAIGDNNYMFFGQNCCGNSYETMEAWN